MDTVVATGVEFDELSMHADIRRCLDQVRLERCRADIASTAVTLVGTEQRVVGSKLRHLVEDCRSNRRALRSAAE